MKNFQDLANKFYSLTFSLSLRSVFLRITAFAATIAIFLINLQWVDTLVPNLAVHIAGTIASTLLVPALFMIMASPLTKMAVTSFYLKSRQKIGFGHSGTAEEAQLSQLTQFTTKRKVFTAASLVLSLLAGNAAYISMVTPMSKPVLTVRPVIEKVADSENAWVEYDKAILDLIEMPMMARLGSETMGKAVASSIVKQTQSAAIWGKLENISVGKAEITQEEIAFLEKHKGAIDHLLKGAKLPKAQFYLESPNVNSTVPSFLEIRALTNLAAAQIQYLQQQGRVKEAVELALASYKMAIDIGAEKNITLISGLISVVSRGIVSRAIITLVNSGTTTAEMDKEIARTIREQDLRLPNAYQLLSWERQSAQASFENILIRGKVEDIGNEFVNNPDLKNFIFSLVPGLRVRAYNSFVKLDENAMSSLRNSLETWNYIEARKISEQLLKNTELNNWILDFDTAISSRIFSIALPNGAASMNSLYNCDVYTKYVVAQAACSAYKKVHGEFPSKLEVAMSEANLPMIKDLATDAPIGYKLENSAPIFWFAGADGKNNGGKIAYEANERCQAIDGKDFVFSYGELPFQPKK